MLSSIPRRLSSDVLLAADPSSQESICQALAIVHAQGIGHLEIYFVFSKITQVSAKLTMQHSEHIRVFQTSGEYRTLGSKGTSHISSYLTRVPGQHWDSGGHTAQDVRMCRHDHVTTRG